MRTASCSTVRARLLVAALALLPAACGGTVEPSQPTIATNAVATAPEPGDRSVPTRVEQALITHDDLGETWSSEDKPPLRSVACGLDPWRDAVVKRSSPIFRSNYFALQETAAAFPSASAARRARVALASRTGQRCFRDALIRAAENELGAAVFSSVRVLREESPQDGVKGIRSEVRTVDDPQPNAIFIDQIRVWRGNYVATAVVTSSSAPLSEALYGALVEIVADRMHEATL